MAARPEPATRSTEPTAAAHESTRASPRGVELRLAIGPAGLGLELTDPVRLGCARVTALTTALPTVKFPVDVSGGVARFRHRHGDLRLVEIEIAAPAAERWAAPLLRGIVGSRVPDVWVRVRPGAATVCVSENGDPDIAGAPAPALAFELHVLAEGDHLVLVVAESRGADLPAPATAVAIACVKALVGPLADRAGAVFVLRSPAGAIAKTILPDAGARAPSSAGVRWRAITSDGASWVLQAGRDELAAPSSDEALRAREIAVALESADEALVRGDLDAARQGYLVALERTPRHPEIVRRLVDIDVRTPGRAEAALATLAELRAPDRAGPFGVAPGVLLFQRGDRDLALASLEREAENEVAPALAARALEMAARQAHDPESALRWLDLALSRAPRSSGARWLRAERRLNVGRLEEAWADLEHLEALARGPRAKHVVWMRAGQMGRAAGLSGRSAPVFERALRYVPDEPGALAGLGAALIAEGNHARGVALLTRALEMAEAAGLPCGAIALDLATALAGPLDDLPSAIARAAAVAADAPEAVVARGLEGRWRARLGDVVGAGLAFARMRDRLASYATLEALAPPAGSPGCVDLLKEAASLELDTRRDAVAAQRYLAEALRLRPHDVALRDLYRNVGATIAGTKSASIDPPATEDPPIHVEARVEELTRKVHADPGDDASADELASLLELLDRGHELLALLSGRLEDATPERRIKLAPRARATLERLAAHATRDGREVEADLYRTAARALPG